MPITPPPPTPRFEPQAFARLPLLGQLWGLLEPWIRGVHDTLASARETVDGLSTWRKLGQGLVVETDSGGALVQPQIVPVPFTPSLVLLRCERLAASGVPDGYTISATVAWEGASQGGSQAIRIRGFSTSTASRWRLTVWGLPG